MKISICHCQKDLGHCAFVLSLHHLLTGAVTYTRNASRGACSCCNYNKTLAGERPHRLVVRMSRCGRDNPGSTPGVDILFQNTCEKKLRRSEAEALSRSGSCNAPRFQKRGLGIEPRTFGLQGRCSATELPWLGYFLLPLLLALSNHAFVGHAGHDFVCGQNALPHKNPQRSVHSETMS